MTRIFDQENKFMAFMYRMTDLLLLNVLWIVTSLPVITLGASTTALYTVVYKMRKNEESYIARSYFKAFRENFRQGTALWLIILGSGGLLYFDMYITAITGIEGKEMLSIVFLITAVLFLLVVPYVFPVLARFDTTVIQILKIATYLSLRHIYYTLPVLAIILVPVIIILSYLYFLPVFLIISVSGSAYLTAYFFQKIYTKYQREE